MAEETKTKRRTSRGTCYLCGGEFGKGAMVRHLDKCLGEVLARQAQGEGAGPPTRFFRLAVEGRDLPEYWLHLDVRADATLEDLDAFLRDLWLECCGHLSAFTIGRDRYRWEPPGGFPGEDNAFFDGLDEVFGMPKERRMDVPLAEVLHVGDTFFHEYDFGSTTELKLRVLSEHEEPTRGRNIRVLARNNPPAYPCEECENPAEWVGPVDEASEVKALCEACVESKDYDREMLLPLVNSPRAGVCGYTGEDRFP